MNKIVPSIIQNKTKEVNRPHKKKRHKMKLFTAAFKTENLYIMCVPTHSISFAFYNFKTVLAFF